MASQKKLQSIVSEIRNFCELNSDEKQAQRYARYFTEGYDAYGVDKEITYIGTQYMFPYLLLIIGKWVLCHK